MVNISKRPPEASDRAVPDHWEGDLMIGKANRTAIATLVERTTGFAMLVALPEGYKPEQVAPALAAKIKTLPEALRRSLTWDQGPAMRDWKQLHVDANIDVYLATRTRPGNAAPTRRPTACCASTSPRAPTSPRSARPTSTESPTNSTTAPASASASPSPPRRSRSYCCTDRPNPPIPYGTRRPLSHGCGRPQRLRQALARDEREVAAATRSATARLSDPLRSSTLDSLYCSSSEATVIWAPAETVATTRTQQ